MFVYSFTCGPTAAKVDVEHSLQQLVGDERHAELGRGATHARHRSLPEGAEPLLCLDLPGRVNHAAIRGLARPCHHLVIREVECVS